ncbi:flavin reductase family protein [Paracoccus shanxieyensis]|uniref:Flavin reductase family protein n=1 Tax=Paracoccus shanxieyensis TaxID=2675752 RepID=A0A6L6J4K7_9RHOB|nr:flavin reductase family protein [Paracoccus shanxieyensis]MTH65654.1 flavin reductase family protein [Paracoccus shanxieyensis]MTH88771.1 flavin reductase family protein [Paracoccus shanxieyensis]
MQEQTAAPPQSDFTRFDFADLSARDRYKLLIGAVVPRPIAWVTTVDRQGRVNAAPFSFFNVLSADPAILAIGVENHDDLRFKDTGHNIRETGEFTVNIVDHANLHPMNVTAVAFPPGVDEVTRAGLTTMPGTHVAAPCIAEAPVAMECRRYVTLSVSASREIVLGEVVAMHVRSSIVNERLHIDPVGLDALGRMGGHGYCRSHQTFDLPGLSPEQVA